LRGVWAAAPWRRAPLLLGRQPVVFLAVALAAAILAVAAASGVLFLSTIGTASFRAQQAGDCPEFSLPALRARVSADRLAALEPVGRASLANATSDPVYSVAIGSARVQDTRVNLFDYPGALDHVHRLTPAVGGPGAWIPDNFAEKINARPGDQVTTADGKTIHVAGVYQSLAPDPYSLSNLPRFFCAWHDLIVPKVLESPTGPLFLVDQVTLAAVSAQPVDVSWYGATAASSALSSLERGPAEANTAAAAFRDRTGVPADVPRDLASKVDEARRAQNGVGGSVVPITLSGVAIATLLVAGAGGFWATARAREIRLLVSRGVGPGALAGKAVLETAPAVLVGLIGGWCAAIGLVRSLGPTDVVPPGSPLRALWIAAVAVLAAVAVIAAIGAAVGRERRIGAPRRWWRQMPWELALLGVGAWVGSRVYSHGAVRVDHGVVTMQPSTFVFPLLAGTGALALLCRLVSLGLPRLGRAQPSGTAAYLAVRRLAGSRAVVVGLLIGTALPCLLLTFASMVTTGIDSDVTAKYRTNLGAPHVLEVVGSLTQAPVLGGSGTPVSVIETGAMLPDGTQARVLGVDPRTFAQFAYVNSMQRAAVDQLGYAGGASAPTILVNAPAGVDASSVTVQSSELGLRAVSSMAVFPGLRDAFTPMLVVDRSVLSRLAPDADRDNQVWTSTAQYGAAVRAILADHFRVLTELDSDVLIGNTGLLPVTWVFGYLKALAVLIGAVSVAGLVFALAARVRRRVVAYVMTRRMGMSQATHIRSLIIELALVVGAGWLAGSLAGVAVDRLIVDRIDVFPDLPPPPSFAWPAQVLGLDALVVAAVVMAAATTTHWLSERARPAEILRVE